MRILLLTFCLLLIQNAGSQELYKRVKINLVGVGLDQINAFGIPMDHGVSKKGHFFISEYSESDLARLDELNIEYEVLIEDVVAYYQSQNQSIPGKNATCPQSATDPEPVVPDNFELGTYAGFYRYQEMLDELDEMAQLYPNLISVRAPIGNFQTHENREIFWVRISDNPSVDETDEPEVLYSAIHHAREPMSMAQLIFYMWYLLENYDDSEEIQHLINNTELYFIPCLNPDGYLFNETQNPNGGGMHRKNRRAVGSSNPGVDLNRNYSYQWGTTGISFDENSDVYPGTSAFSEPETQAMKWFCEQHNFISAMNAHSYGDLMLFPIGATSNEFADDHSYFELYTDHMVRYSGYANQKSSALYPASGGSDDYMYKEDLTVKPEIFALTPEVGLGAEGFWPPMSKIEENAKNMVEANLIAAHLPHRYLITEDIDPNRIDPAQTFFSFQVTRIGQENGVVSVGIDPIQNIASVGANVDYNIALETSLTGNISFSLTPGLQGGEEVIYVLKTIYPTWTDRDTIVKIYGDIPLQVLDNGEVPPFFSGDWTKNGHTVYSPNEAYSDSENGTDPANYANNSFSVFTYNHLIDLRPADLGQISFRAKWAIESDYDAVQFQVSTDNGDTWIAQCGNYTVPGVSGNGSVQPEGEPVYEGTQNNWVLEEIDLSDYFGQEIMVRFVLMSDGGVTDDGFYFDDFKISHNGWGLGIQEEIWTMQMYPNPTEGNLFLHFDQVQDYRKVEIMDLAGKIVAVCEFNAVNDQVVIDLSSLNTGMYLLNVKNRSGQIMSKRKVIRQ